MKKALYKEKVNFQKVLLFFYKSRKCSKFAKRNCDEEKK